MVRTRTRVLLALEFLIGALPGLVFYVYHFPVGVFWVRRVLELAGGGTTNAFTTSIALIFVAGGIGAVSLCILFLARLAGAGPPGRALFAGLLLGLAAASGMLFVAVSVGAFWTDYYLFGLPILVGAHLLYLAVRHGARRPRASQAALP
ncbi:MAG TPA: hypothetical protein VIY27_09775 [Myxococcota bacterium]